MCSMTNREFIHAISRMGKMMKTRTWGLLALVVMMMSVQMGTTFAYEAAAPKAAMAKFVKAMNASDAKAAASFLHTEKQGNKILAASFKDLIEVSKKHEKVSATLTRKFGKDAQLVMEGFVTTKLITNKLNPETTVVKMAPDGKSCTVYQTDPNEEEEGIQMIKTKKGWKIDFTSVMSEREIKAFTGVLRGLNPKMGEIQKEAESAKSLKQFKDYYDKVIHIIVDKL